MSSLRTPKNTSAYELHPPGMFVASCYQVIDLGTHYSERFDKSTHLVRIQFESSRKMADGRPFSIGKQYTLSHYEKANLRKDLESWYAKRFDSAKLDEANGFDLAKILRRPAMITVVHDDAGDKTYANVVSINALPEGTVAPPIESEVLLFSLAEFDSSVFAKLTDSTKKKIDESIERGGRSGPSRQTAPPAAEPPRVEPDFNDDDIPF